MALVAQRRKDEHILHKLGAVSAEVSGDEAEEKAIDACGYLPMRCLSDSAQGGEPLVSCLQVNHWRGSDYPVGQEAHNR